MVNKIVLFLLLIGILTSFFLGRAEVVNKELITSGSLALEMIFKMLPLMCLWLGIMNIAKKSGLLDKISKALTPVLKFLFPEVPGGSEALSFIASNIVMNMVGLGNAATPFGLKTMKSLQELNNKKDVASRSMITFLIINTSGVTIIPTTVISLRLLNGSTNPTEIVTASIIATFLSCIFGLILDRIFYSLWRKKHERY